MLLGLKMVNTTQNDCFLFPSDRNKLSKYKRLALSLGNDYLFHHIPIQNQPCIVSSKNKKIVDCGNSANCCWTKTDIFFASKIAFRTMKIKY